MQIRKKIIHRLTRLVLIIVGLFLLLSTTAVIYIQYNKNRILSEVIQTAGKRIGGRIAIGEISVSMFQNFPRISILLKDVTVNDSIHQKAGESIFKAGKVFIGLKWGSLLSGNIKANNIVITDGNILLLTDSTGYTNKYLLKPKGGKGEKSHLPQIRLYNTVFAIRDFSKQKDHEFLINRMSFEEAGDSITALEGDIDITVHKMIFNPDKGSYLKGKRITGKVLVKFENNGLDIKNTALNIDNSAFVLSAHFDLGNNDPQFNLAIKASQVEYHKLRGMMPGKLDSALSIADLDKPLDATASITGYLRKGIPLVNISWVVKDAYFKTPLQNFDHASFAGRYTDEVTPGYALNDSNSLIELTGFTAEWNGLPVHSKSLTLINLTTPELKCDLVSAVSLPMLSQFVKSFNFIKGSADISVSYKGPLQLSQANSHINGLISISGGQLIYVPRNVALNKVGGEIVISNSNVALNHFKMTVADQLFEMNATAANLITLLDIDPATASINFKIATPSADIGSLFFLLKKRSDVSSHKGKKLNTAFSKIDDLMEKGQLHVLLNAGKLAYKKFNATDVSADVSIASNNYIINALHLNHAGGFINLNGNMLNTANHYTANVNFAMKDMDVEKLFYAFDNFGQDGIMSSNLKGKLDVNANAVIRLDSSGNISPGSVNSTVHFLLKEGRLINFEPIKKMQKFIFKNRNFDDISFADLNNTFFIRQKEVLINKMEIRSTVCTLFVEGLYSQEGKTDISIQVPLSNLNKKQDILPDVANKRKTGSSIFLRGRPGKDGKIEFKLDLFKKFQSKL